MRAWILLYVLPIGLVCGFGASALGMDTKQEEITYPQKQNPTEIKEIVANFDSLASNVKDLGGTMVGDIKKQGLKKSVVTHQKFYGSIFVFGLLFIIWLKTRDR